MIFQEAGQYSILILGQVTVKISEGSLILLADCNEVQELRKELYQVKQAVKGIRDGMFNVLNEC